MRFVGVCRAKLMFPMVFGVTHTAEEKSVGRIHRKSQNCCLVVCKTI